MRIRVVFELNDHDREAMGWWQDGGSEAFTCRDPAGRDYRTAHRGRRAKHQDARDFCADYGDAGIEQLVAEYDRWLELPLRDELPETEEGVFEDEAPELDELEVLDVGAA